MSIKIGSEELTNAGSASYDGTSLNKIIYNGTVVWQKDVTGLIGANIEYTPRYEDGVLKVDIEDITWATTSDEAFEVSGTFVADLEVWAAVQSGPTTYTVYTGRTNVSVDLGSVSVPANQSAYPCSFAKATVSVPVESSTTTSVPINKVEDNIETVFMTRNGFSTTVSPWHIGWGFTY